MTGSLFSVAQRSNRQTYVDLNTGGGKAVECTTKTVKKRGKVPARPDAPCPSQAVWRVTDAIASVLKKKMTKMYKALGKADVMFLDGRLDKSNQLNLLGLSLSETTTAAYQYAGYTYQETIAPLLYNATQSPKKKSKKK